MTSPDSTASSSPTSSNGSTSSSSSTSSTGPTASDGTTAGRCEQVVDCPRQAAPFVCGDGQDNDGDGLVDFDDPDCLSVCDPTEYAFGFLDLTKDAACDFDCAFDSNAGQGDDMCLYSPRCDPASEWPVCPYDPGLACDGIVDAPPECVAFCQPLVPNGCDCFGCCEVITSQGPAAVFVDNPNCTPADDYADCGGCTPHLEVCGNPCEVDACEICVGQTAPAAGCDEVGCVGGIPCAFTCDCPEGHGCITGCCLPGAPV